MAYTITLTDGTLFATIPDGSYNTDSSMTLVGKNFAGYGAFLDENFIHLLENGSNTTAPTTPLVGQLWWDSTNSLLKVRSGSGDWKVVSGAASSGSAPSGAVSGDLWFDTSNQQLKTYNGTSWVVIGPAYSAAQGTSGAVPETITDNTGNTRYITSLYVNNVRVGVVYGQSANSTLSANFTPQASLVSTFPNIYTGMTLSSDIAGNVPIYMGTANNSNYLNSLTSTQFMRSDTNTSTTGVVRVLNDTGLYAGTGNAINIAETGNDGIVQSTISGGNLLLQANVGGSTYLLAEGYGANGVVTFPNAVTGGSTLSITGNITGGNLRTGGQVSATGNITGGNVNTTLVAATTVSATANVQGGNIRTAGLISATGNITSAGNVDGVYFLGNGYFLSGLSAAVSVTKIENGTSEVRIGATGGNANVTIGGVSNVVVFTNSGTQFANAITVPSIEKSGSNAVGNIGSTSNYFNRVFATATTALYADVAERFAADEPLEAGTVVELGGTKEITRSQDELSENIFGVISTRPAYLMNGGAGEDNTHPPVAMTGRVPVRVIGVVRKGDRLVSAGNGQARAAQPGEATAFNVIGRALEDKFNIEDGTIEAIVTIK